MPYLGELLSVASAATWSLAVVLYRRAQDVPVLAINLLKNTTALLLTGATMLAVGSSFEGDRGPDYIARLLLSGLLGLGVGDVLFLWSLKRIGPGVAAIVETAYAPSVVVLAVALNGELIRPGLWIGAPLVLLGIVTASEPWARRGNATEAHGIDRNGVVVATLSMIIMALGIVVAKPALERAPVVEATAIRMVGALTFQFALLLVSQDRRKTLSVFVPGPVWPKVLPSAVLGTYVAMLFWIGGMKYAPASVSALLNQTSTIFTLLFARVIVGEKLTPPRLAGMAMAFCGAIVIVRG